MGSCFSIHRESNSDMKIRRSFGSKVRTLFHPSSPANNRVSNGENPVKTNGFDLENKNFGFVLPAKSASTKDLFGSKDEIFFDSRAWLDSDCEDDFLSVNGDFTPSGCTTPNHQSSVPGTPIPKPLRVEMASDHNPETNSSETSPTDKMKLADLLKDSFREGEEDGAPNEQNGPTIENNNMVVVKSREETLGASGRKSGNEKTSNRELKWERDRKLKVGQCCLPGLVTSFNDRKEHQHGG